MAATAIKKNTFSRDVRDANTASIIIVHKLAFSPVEFNS